MLSIRLQIAPQSSAHLLAFFSTVISLFYKYLLSKYTVTNPPSKFLHRTVNYLTNASNTYPSVVFVLFKSHLLEPIVSSMMVSFLSHDIT